jgi:ribosomal protein S18 acetylase RimI-like enzyme
MTIPEYIGRFFHYAKHHGWWGTIKRALLGLRRMLTGTRYVLFYCDLARFEAAPLDETVQGRVQRMFSGDELDPKHVSRIMNARYPAVVSRQIAERFAQGASLWLFELEDKLAAYGWSLIGNTMEPHFFPLGGNDVHLFDFFVFPEYRGRRVNPLLVRHILNSLALEGKARAFIEAAEWNTEQLRSLKRMPFQKLGHARKHSLLGRMIVVWSEGNRIGKHTPKHLTKG